MKDDLISRSDLLELYADTPEIKLDVYHVPIPVVRQNILDMPAVDAVPVVRCFECKHRGKEDACPMWSREQPTTDWDEYCSRGERRDND